MTEANDTELTALERAREVLAHLEALLDLMRDPDASHQARVEYDPDCYAVDRMLSETRDWIERLEGGEEPEWLTPEELEEYGPDAQRDLEEQDRMEDSYRDTR